MKIKNLKVATVTALFSVYLIKAIGAYQSCVNIESLIDDINTCTNDLDEIKNNLDELEPVVQQIDERLTLINWKKTKTVEESSEYKETSKYMSEITEEEVDAYVKEVLDFYGIPAKSNTFRFNPNNLQEAERRIKAYAEKIDTEENSIFTTEYHICSTLDDYLVSSYKKEYQENHPEAIEEELKELEKEFKEKAAATYYTAMNLKYLSDETLRSMNEKYHFVEDSENLIEDIKDHVNSTIIGYTSYPLMREMVANEGDYIAHGLLNMDDTVWQSYKIINNQIVDEVIQEIYGNGEERKENIYAEGYCSYEIIQEAVNQKLGVGKNQEDVFHRIQNGKVVSNLPELPTDLEELCKYALIELKFQSKHDGFYESEYYNPSELLITFVIKGHSNQIDKLLYETEKIPNCTERKILENRDETVFFETADKIPEITETNQKKYK